MIRAISSAALFLTALCALIFDLRTGKIPNVFLCAMLMISIVLACLTDGAAGLGRSLLCTAIPCALFFPLFHFRMIGAGDIKLFAVFGSFLTPRDLMILLLLILLLSALLSVLIMLRRGIFGTRLLYFFRYIADLIKNPHTPPAPYRLPGDRPEHIHLAFPAFLGTLIYLGETLCIH